MKKLNRKARRSALQPAIPNVTLTAVRQSAAEVPWTPAIRAEIARGDRTVVALCNHIAQGLHDSADISDKDAHYSESLVRVCLANAIRAFGHVLGDACTHYGIALPVTVVPLSTVITQETVNITTKAVQDYGLDPKIVVNYRPGQVMDKVFLHFTDMRLSDEEQDLPIACMTSMLYSEKTMPINESPDYDGIWARMREAEERTPTERTATALTPLVLFDAAVRLPGKVSPSPRYWSPPVQGSAPGLLGGATMSFTMLHEPIPGTIVGTTLTLCLDQMAKLTAKLDKKRH